MFPPPPYSYVKTLPPNVMVLEVGLWEAIRIRYRLEGRALMNEISALLRVIRELASSLLSAIFRM